MNNTFFSFLLTFLAGFSTMIGTLIIFFTNKKTDNIIVACLSFAVGIMISISLINLIPESFNLLKTNFISFPAILLCLIFFITGICISMTIDNLVPKNNSNNLYRVGVISMIAIILHNVPEGIATFLSSTNNLQLGITLSIAIALHNIPEGICISLPIYYSTKSRGKALFYTFISAISEPFGALIALILLKPYINNISMGFLYAIIAGIMIYISLYELLDEIKKYKKQILSFIFIIIGSIIMVINHLL